MDKVLGCDCSFWQGEMDWQTAKDAGIFYAFLRSSFGNHETDKQIKRNWAETKRIGMPRGAYHFLLSYQSIESQINRFLSPLGNDYGELPFVCDVEKWESRDGLYKSYPGLKQAESFCNTIEDRTGHPAMIYSSPGWWNYMTGVKNATWALDHLSWVAHYTSNPAPQILYPWDDWTFWQYTQGGDGYKYGTDFGSKAIDLNWYNGSMEQFVKQFKLDGHEEIPEDPNAKQYVKTTVNLRGRAKPVYVYGDSALVFKQGQILEKADAPVVIEESSGIEWLPITMYVSKKYIREV